MKSTWNGRGVWAIAFLFTRSLLAQPPAQGPAPATANAFSFYPAAITGVIEQTVRTILNEQNAAFQTDPKYRAHITYSYQSWSPYMAPTTHLDRPNEFAAHTRYIFTYTVRDMKANIGGVFLPYLFDRTLTQSISVQTTCDGWHRGQGTLRHAVTPSPLYLEGDHTFPEDAFGFLMLQLIPNYIDSQIRKRTANITQALQTMSTSTACNTLGVATKAAGFPSDSIQHDIFPAPPRTSGLTAPITVRVVKVKRLRLRNVLGALVGDPVETPNFELWAGHSVLSLDMTPLTEEQTWFPPANTVSTPVPGGSSLLVLIANLLHTAGTREDHSWVAYAKTSNYGNGTQTFYIMRNWLDPARVTGEKPAPRTGKAYEVTVQITAPQSTVTQ